MIDRIGKILKEYRTERNLSQGKFADDLGISRVSYNHYENGNRLVDSKVLKRICEVTGLSADYIIGLSETKNVAQSDIAKTTGLSEDAIEFLRVTKKNNNFLNELISLIIEEETVPIDCYWDELFDQNCNHSEDIQIKHNNLHVLDEIKKHWEINDFECPIDENEPANSIPFEYTMIEEMYSGEDVSITRKDYSKNKEDMVKTADIYQSKGMFSEKSNLLDSIEQYVRFKNGGIGLLGSFDMEPLNRNHCISLWIGGKPIRFPSEESDKIVEQLLLQNVIDSLNKLKDRFNKTKNEDKSL